MFCEPLLAWYIRLQDRGFLHVCGNLCTSPFLVVHSAISFNGCNLLVSIMGRPAFTLWAYIIWRLCRSFVPDSACPCLSFRDPASEGCRPRRAPCFFHQKAAEWVKMPRSAKLSAPKRHAMHCFPRPRRGGGPPIHTPAHPPTRSRTLGSMSCPCITKCRPTFAFATLLYGPQGAGGSKAPRLVCCQRIRLHGTGRTYDARGPEKERRSMMTYPPKNNLPCHNNKN